MNTLRQHLRPMRAKSSALAVGIFAIDAVLYAVATTLAIRTHNVVYSVAAGVTIAMLFVAGHDACHGSFTPSRGLNGWLGRLAFLPSITPFGAWDEAHNRTHHVYTNWRSRDYIWSPFTKREFDGLARLRRLLERAYRTFPGLALYYGIEVWGKTLIFARGAMADSLLAAAYGLGLCAGAFYAGGLAGLLTGAVAPFLIWNWLMGWAIFEHHTHPRVPWFDDEQEWRAADPQTRCTIHIVLPGPFDFLVHRIMQHTAHHLDVTVPLYHLKEAQSAVEAAAAEVVTYRWSPFTLLRHLRTCKLYDFEAHCWLDFDGARSAPAIPAPWRGGESVRVSRVG